MNKVKIFISYKDRHPLIQSNILTPIQTGRAISPEIFNDMIGDDTGENISEKNNMYNELSAQYWAWKNYQIIGNPDYIGFMHYRRHFIFNEKKYEHNFLGVVPFKCINNEYIREIGLDDDNIYNFIKNYDIVCIKRLDLKYRANILNNKKCCNPRECYAYNRHLYKKDYDKMIEVLNKLNPEYTYAAKQYTEGSISFGYNSFVMKKDIFFEYNNFLFPILFELEKNIDFTNYCNQGIRTIGYLGERLLSIFIIYKLNSDKCKIKETPMSFIENSKELQSNPEPVFGKECIVMTSSNFFAPYTYVAIMSMIEKYDTQKKLDLVILTKNMSSDNKEKFIKDFSSSHISIRFYDMNAFILPSNIKVTNSITEETYFRLFIPSIFKKYEKVLFCDSDVIFNYDVSKIFNIDLKDNKLGLVIDSVMQCFCVDNIHNDFNYIKNTLLIENPFLYYNCGIILFNIEYITQNDIENIFNLLSDNTYIYFDQDVINMYFKDSIKAISPEWNFNPVTLKKEIYAYMPVSYIKTFEMAKNNPFIIHYNSSYKPWNFPNEPFSDLWWSVARRTTYYEEIILRMCRNTQRELNENIEKNIKQLRSDFENIHFPNINNSFNLLNTRLNNIEKNNNYIKYIINKLKLYINKKCAKNSF